MKTPCLAREVQLFIFNFEFQELSVSMRIVICNMEVFQNWFKRSTLVSLIFLYEIEIEFKSHIVLLNA